METVTLSAKVRESFGTPASNKLREEGRVPAVIYGDNESIHISLDYKELKPLVYTPKFKAAEIQLNGNTHKCIIKELQFHPQSDDILHIDFMELIDGRTIRTQIPILLHGQPEGVKEGGKLYQKIRKAKIKANAENLIDKLELDVSYLEFGQSIRIRDIEDIEGVEIMNSPGIPIASVEVPRVLRRLAEEEAALEEAEELEGEEGEEGAPEGEGTPEGEGGGGEESSSEGEES
ncbi:MAG: 50S ribosomal protein L25 [Saprospiraceae bacterium]|nr:50S ribosomal protein L25 [Saprospiraceae bacterium]